MRRMITVGGLLCLLLASTAVAQEQQKLTNKDVVQMLSLGLAPDVVVEKIYAGPTAFDTSVDGLKSLKDAGVPDSVLKVMINPTARNVDQKNGKPMRIKDELTAAYQKWQNSVFTVWSEVGRGTGFLFDSSGLILTNQHVIGPSEYVAVQFDPGRKVEAKVLAADPEKDVAVLWANMAAFPEALPAPLGLKNEVEGTVVEGERVFTIGSPLHQRKVLTTGVVSKVEPRAIISDININHGNSGGPLFNSLGNVVGITTFGDFTRAGGPGISGILRIEQAATLIEVAKGKLSSAVKPKPDLLPVEPLDAFPLDAIKSSLLADKFDFHEDSTWVKHFCFTVGAFC